MQSTHLPANATTARGFGRVSEGKVVESNPLRFLPLAMFATMLAVFAATGYLVLREDIVNSALSRQARMQQAYEDRITALRAQVDIVTSRQMLDQQAVENRVEQLVARQRSLSEREKFMREALGRAKKAGAVPNLDRTKKPLTTGSVITKNAPLRLGSLVGSHSPFGGQNTDTNSAFGSWNVAKLPKPDHSFDEVERSLEISEQTQIVKLASAISKANEKAKRLASVLSRQGIKLPKNPESGIGGPLIVLKSGDKFLDTVATLDSSLERLSKVRRFANRIPHGNPTPGQKISSRYGTRTDPFTGRKAVHGGLDFKARTGVPVRATASGTIVKAGRHGGYGKLVEIKHINGMTTRYAHLSRIKVRIGQRVAKGTTVGNVGSTGRSTGPHLHYEVRKNGKTLNPLRYVKLGKALRPYF